MEGTISPVTACGDSVALALLDSRSAEVFWSQEGELASTGSLAMRITDLVLTPDQAVLVNHVSDAPSITLMVVDRSTGESAAFREPVCGRVMARGDWLVWGIDDDGACVLVEMTVADFMSMGAA